MRQRRDPFGSGGGSRSRSVRGWILLGACVAVVLLLFAACGNKGSKSDSAAGAQHSGGGAPGSAPFGARGGFGGGIPVQAVSVKYGPLDAVHNVAGTVVPVTQSQVAAQASGVVKRVVHHAGDWVSAGQTVVQLDDSQVQLAVKNAQVALQNAQINLTTGEQNTTFDRKKLELQLQATQSSLAAAQKNYDALESAAKLGSVAASDVDTAKSQLQQAEANNESAKTAVEQNKNAENQSIAQLKLAVQTAQNQLAQAKLNLANTSIVAPFAGQISVVHVALGEFVGQNTPAFLLVSSDRQIGFNVPPSDAPTVAVGKNVNFTVGGDTYKAVINQAPSAPVNGVVPLTAKLVGSTALPFGTVGTVSYPITVSTGTLVPLAALQNDGAQNYVFTILQGKAHVQPITILGETGSTAAVGQLQSGAEVVLNPPPGLLEGASVKPAGNEGSGQAQAAPGGTSGTHAPSGGSPQTDHGPQGAQGRQGAQGTQTGRPGESTSTSRDGA